MANHGLPKGDQMNSLSTHGLDYLKMTKWTHLSNHVMPSEDIKQHAYHMVLLGSYSLIPTYSIHVGFGWVSHNVQLPYGSISRIIILLNAKAHCSTLHNSLFHNPTIHFSTILARESVVQSNPCDSIIQIHNSVLWDWQYSTKYPPHWIWMGRIFYEILSVPQTLLWI